MCETKGKLMKIRAAEAALGTSSEVLLLGNPGIVGKACGLLPCGIRRLPVGIGAHEELVGAAADLLDAAGLRAASLHLGQLLVVAGA